MKKVKWIAMITGFLITLGAGFKFFYKGKEYDEYDKKVANAQKNNKKLVDEHYDYSERRMRFHKDRKN